ncbi:MAG: AAA family ATPase [Gemmatimonadota bacterium]|nr:AAA family ATPase [Gemmatimonadota bacterium]
MIVLRALGAAEIDTGVSRLTPSQEVVFAAAVYLILERGKRVSRARLASLLWPRVAEKARAHRLRQTILQLKKLGIVVRADRDTLHLSQLDARSDIEDLLAPDLDPVLGKDSLEFLPGYNPRLSEALRDWVDSKRSEAHAAATKLLVAELERSRLQGDWPNVERTAAKCLSLDAYNETAVLAQAEAAAMRGGKRKAISILDRYIADVGGAQHDLRLPATLLRRRVVERTPDRPPLLNTEPPFVGREFEMESLTRSFERAKRGHGSGTLIVGEPGIGKSRLSTEVGRFADLQGAQIQRVTCRRADVDRPLSLFVDIVPQLREMPGALGCASETFTWLKRLTEFEQRSEDSRQIDSDALFQNVRAALFDLLDSVAEERCLVILIEDVQWLDNASARILARMMEWCATRHLFFLLNSRPGSSPFLDYVEQSHLHTLALGPLKPVASTALLQSVAMRPGDEPKPEFIDWCLTVAEGNPFFLQELAHQWIETGRRHEAPPSVTKVLQERLSRLSGEALQVLQTCAVLSDHATLDRVEKVLEYPPHQLLSAVAELSRAAMLSTPNEGKDVSPVQIQPRHDFLASAVMSQLPAVSLAFIHRRSADVLETEIADATMPATMLWACARHRHHAGERQKALSLSMACAEHLLDLGLAEGAAAAFQKSLDYCGTDGQRLSVLPRLSFCYQLNGEWERSKEVLRSCIRLADKVDPSSNGHNDFELLLFTARHQSALDFSSLLADLIPCVESADATPAHRVRAAILALKIATDIGPGEALDSIYSNVEPFLDSREVSEPARLEIKMIYRTTRGHEILPLQELQQFTESARQNGGELAYSNALMTASAACRITARYEEGLAFVAQAFDQERANKSEARLSRLLVAELRLHVAAGAFPAAESTLDRLMECSISADDDFAHSEIQSYKARIALEKGDVAKASAAFAQVQSLPLTYSPRRRANLLALRLRIRLQESAMKEEVRPLVSELETEHLRVRGLGGHDFEAHALYLGLCAIGDADRAIQLLLEYVECHRGSNWPLPDQIRQITNERRESLLTAEFARGEESPPMSATV